jgi:hypothetical protein
MTTNIDNVKYDLSGTYINNLMDNPNKTNVLTGLSLKRHIYNFVSCEGSVLTG